MILTTMSYTGMKLIGHPLILILMMIMVTPTSHVPLPTNGNNTQIPCDNGENAASRI